MYALVMCAWLCYEPLLITSHEHCEATRIKMAVKGLVCKPVDSVSVVVPTHDHR